MSPPNLEIGLFGHAPADLAPAPKNAAQFSPLHPGSSDLAQWPPHSLSSFTMLVSPGTIERRYHLAFALRALKIGGTLLALGPKDKGGSRIKKELEAFGCEVEEESKSHHRLCRATISGKENEEAINAAILEGSPRLEAEMNLWTQPGVFSWNRVDAGSALFAEHLPAFHGRGADLGSGIGFLSREILKSKEISQLTLVEIDRRALDCARQNISQKRVDFLWTDLRAADTKLSQLDFVVMNPPFHDGGIEDQNLGKTFLSQAAHMLKPGGACWIVANRHLPYEEILRSVFQEVRSVTEKGIYKVFEAKR